MMANIDKCPFCQKKLEYDHILVDENNNDWSRLFCGCIRDKYNEHYGITITIKNNKIYEISFLMKDYLISLYINKNYTEFHHFEDCFKDFEFDKIINFDFSSEQKLKEKVKFLLTFN